MTEIWEMLGHKQICLTVTIEWLEPTVGLIRFLYSGPADYPYRGVVSVHVTGTEYEFKGMVFRASDDAPSLAEHRAVKGYLKSLGYQGMARRLKNGKVVVKQYGNFAKTQTVENINMANPKLVVTMDFVDESGESAADVVATFKKMSYEQIVNTQKAVAGSIIGLGDLNVAAKAASAA